MLSSWSSWFLYEPPLLQESVSDSRSQLVKLNNNLESWKIKSLPDLVRSKGIFLCSVCWRKMISSSIGPCDQLLDLLSYPIYNLSMGYHPIRPEPTIFVMLSYSWLIPRAYTIISLVWPMLSPCSLNYGIPFKRKPRWIVVEPIDNILISSIILLNIKLVLEIFESICSC